MFIGVASLRTILSSVQEAFCHLPFYRYSVLDHCRSILSKRGAIQITYCICLLLRNSCLRHATVTTRIGKNLYVTDIVRITFKHTKSTSKKVVLRIVSSINSEEAKNVANKEDMKIRKCR